VKKYLIAMWMVVGSTTWAWAESTGREKSLPDGVQVPLSEAVTIGLSPVKPLVDALAKRTTGFLELRFVESDDSTSTENRLALRLRLDTSASQLIMGTQEFYDGQLDSDGKFNHEYPDVLPVHVDVEVQRLSGNHESEFRVNNASAYLLGAGANRSLGIKLEGVGIAFENSRELQREVQGLAPINAGFDGTFPISPRWEAVGLKLHAEYLLITFNALNNLAPGESNRYHRAGTAAGFYVSPGRVLYSAEYFAKSHGDGSMIFEHGDEAATVREQGVQITIQLPNRARLVVERSNIKTTGVGPTPKRETLSTLDVQVPWGR